MWENHSERLPNEFHLGQGQCPTALTKIVYRRGRKLSCMPEKAVRNEAAVTVLVLTIGDIIYTRACRSFRIRRAIHVTIKLDYKLVSDPRG